MITITRALAHRVRSVFRRALGNSTRLPLCLRLAGAGDGLRIQAIHDQVAIEFHMAGPLAAEELVLPLDALASCGNKNCQEPLQIRAGGNQLFVEWTDNQIPQQQSFDATSAELAPFPAALADTVANPSDLLAALAAASDTTDALSSRFALGCVQLRGQAGTIAATDGRQLLVHRGWQFPWRTDLLIPANKVFAAAELAIEQPVHVGHCGDWVLFRTGPWSIYLHVQKEGRFPQIDDMLRNPASANSRLTIAPADVRFASDAITRLPVGDDDSRAVTMDLNGEVLLRARAKVGTPATEVHLSNSHVSGSAVRLVSDRKFLGRALALGFTELSLYGPEAIVQAHDERRNYIWMPWSADGAVPADADTRRITSTLGGTVSTKRRTHTAHKSVETVLSESITQPQQQQRAMSETESKPASQPTSGQSPIEQVSQLRTALHDALTRTNELLRMLKRQRKQSRLVETTLQSLKQLQQVA